MTKALEQEAIASSISLSMNRFSVQHIFDKYEEVGFLYPAKKKLLTPHFNQIRHNWEKLYHTEECLLWTLAKTDDTPKRNFASISVWRQSNHGLFAQHLVSTGNPMLSLQVMLKAQYLAKHQMVGGIIHASQNWFRPNNRYAYRVFASMFDKLGPEKAALHSFQYLHQPLGGVGVSRLTPFRVEEVTHYDKTLESFVTKQYGTVFAQGEELNQNDATLAKVGAMFNKYGGVRYRKLLKITDQSTNQLVAAVIANRAPLGLNFSFLENRAYYIIDHQLTNRNLPALLEVMNGHVAEVYEDFALKVIPVVTDQQTADGMIAHGAIFQRTYMQSIWLRAGFDQWYDHIHSFLQKIERRNTINQL